MPTLPEVSPHREWKAKVFLYKGWTLRGFFWISIVICKLFPIPRRVSFCYCLKRKSLAGAREDWIKSVLKK